jgi:hypothetical protein
MSHYSQPAPPQNLNSFTRPAPPRPIGAFCTQDNPQCVVKIKKKRSELNHALCRPQDSHKQSYFHKQSSRDDVGFLIGERGQGHNAAQES